MSERRKLRLGTRGSLLAVAQSNIVARQLRAAHPELDIELVRMATRGDRDLETPLTEVNDADFFSAELDRQLLAGDIDICVHSSKDLGARPEGIVCGALPAREQPHDVVLFRADIDAVLAEQRPLRIGTCSLRRQINVGDFLPQALPGNGHKIEFVSLRGAVDARVRRISAADADRLDGVVIALAGLNRLWQDPAGHAAIVETLASARRMVLPLSECPPASGQGVLAVECRADDHGTRELLAAIHDPLTETLLHAERQLLPQSDPDNCGAVAVAEPELGFVAWLRGRSPAGDLVTACTSGAARATPLAGDACLLSGTKQIVPLPAELPAQGALFVAHWRALDNQNIAPEARVWVSGVQSWFRLARNNIWVEGCGDNLGFNNTTALLQSPALNLPALADWTAVTHADAVASWAGSGVGKVVATYRSVLPEVDAATAGEIANKTHFYWSSAREYRQVQSLLPADAQHACGTGKTLAELRAEGVRNVQAFPSRREWQAWLP